MLIKSHRFFKIQTKGGVVQVKPGGADYKLDVSDPIVQEQLRVLRKHKAISFDELLPCDIAVLDKQTGTPEERAKAFDTAIHTSASQHIVIVPVGAEHSESEGRKNANRGNQSDGKAAQEAGEKSTPDKSGGRVPSKAKN